MTDKVRKLIGSNMDIDFSNRDFGSTACSWNADDKTGSHNLAVAISVIPILLVFACFSKHIISSVTAGAAKE